MVFYVLCSKLGFDLIVRAAKHIEERLHRMTEIQSSPQRMEDRMEQMVTWLAAENHILKTKLDAEQQSCSTLRSRLSVSFKGLKILHAQRPLEDDPSNLTIVTDKLLDQLQELDRIDHELKIRLAATEDRERQLMHDYSVLKFEHVRVLEISQKVKAAYEAHMQDSNSRYIALLEEHRLAEHKLDCEKSKSEGLKLALENAERKISSVEAARSCYEEQTASHCRQLEDQLARARADKAASERALDRERLLHARVRAQAAERTANLKRLMAHAQRLEGDAADRSRSYEELEEECLVLRMELARARAGWEEQERVVEMLDQQCALYEDELARPRPRHIAPRPAPAGKLPRRIPLRAREQRPSGDCDAVRPLAGRESAKDTGGCTARATQDAERPPGDGPPGCGEQSPIRPGKFYPASSPSGPPTSSPPPPAAPDCRRPPPSTAAAGRPAGVERRPLQALDRNALRPAPAGAAARACTPARRHRDALPDDAAASLSRALRDPLAAQPPPSQPPAAPAATPGAARVDMTEGGGGGGGGARRAARAALAAAGMLTAVRARGRCEPAPD
jgi:hypothetical protein